MISTHVDLGQIIIASMLGIIGYFVKRELASISNRLDKHDGQIIGLIKTVAEVYGAMNARSGAATRRINDSDSMERHD
jgi:ABC-type transporter Mla subunit MlaD